MKTTFVLVVTMLVGFCEVRSCVAASEKSDNNDNVIVDRDFKIIGPDGERELGRYGIRAEIDDAGESIKIVETSSINYRGKPASAKSTVTYRIDSELTPTSGVVETKVDGNTCMTGSLAIEGREVTGKCTGHTNKRTGEAIDPPKEMEKTFSLPAEGFILFQSSVMSIGPRILPEEGELTDVIFVEFPDDLGAPELVNFKKEYRLVREAADERGVYKITVFSPRKDPIMSARFDANDQLMANQRRGRVSMVAVEEELP